MPNNVSKGVYISFICKCAMSLSFSVHQLLSHLGTLRAHQLLIYKFIPGYLIYKFGPITKHISLVHMEVIVPLSIRCLNSDSLTVLLTVQYVEVDSADRHHIRAPPSVECDLHLCHSIEVKARQVYGHILGNVWGGDKYLENMSQAVLLLPLPSVEVM